jgi:hypothetical protein
LAGGEEPLIMALEQKKQMKYPAPFCFAHIKPGRYKERKKEKEK